MDLQNSDSPPWNEIECKYVHTHLIHLNLWKAPWIEWAFHFIALPEIVSFHLPFWNSFVWDRIRWLPLKQGLRLWGPPINDVAALLSCTGTGREIPLVRNWHVGSWHWERLLHYFWLKPTLNIPQPISPCHIICPSFCLETYCPFKLLCAQESKCIIILIWLSSIIITHIYIFKSVHLHFSHYSRIASWIEFIVCLNIWHMYTYICTCIWGIHTYYLLLLV